MAFIKWHKNNRHNCMKYSFKSYGTSGSNNGSCDSRSHACPLHVLPAPCEKCSVASGSAGSSSAVPRVNKFSTTQLKGLHIRRQDDSHSQSSSGVMSDAGSKGPHGAPEGSESSVRAPKLSMSGVSGGSN